MRHSKSSLQCEMSVIIHIIPVCAWWYEINSYTQYNGYCTRVKIENKLNLEGARGCSQITTHLLVNLETEVCFLPSSVVGGCKVYKP